MLFKAQTNHSLHQVTFSPDFRNSGDTSLHNVELLPSSAQRFHDRDGTYRMQSLLFDGTHFHAHIQINNEKGLRESVSNTSFKPSAFRKFDFINLSSVHNPDICEYMLTIVFNALQKAETHTIQRGQIREDVGAIIIKLSEFHQVKPFCNKFMSIVNSNI